MLFQLIVPRQTYPHIIRSFVKRAVELEKRKSPLYTSMLARIRDIQACVPPQERDNLYWAVEFALRATMPTSRKRKAQCAQLAFLRVNWLLQSIPQL